MARTIMIQGTMSNAGKSIVAAGLCRIFKQDGYRVSPFKSQNMALNSYITKEGLEMGRAQVMQAEAAGREPVAAMNPILLKPTSDTGSQVIVNGISRGNMSARDYFAYKKSLIPDIRRAFRSLEEDSDIIVIEGAGSPAEVNLRENDIVNMGLAQILDAPVLLVGDIDRGGVFAQLVGTMALLEDNEKERVKGLVINKFRGDESLLTPGIDILTKRTHIPTVGIIPWVRLKLDDEDSLSERLENTKRGAVDIAVVRLPHISNFTDFDVFDEIDEAGVRYISRPKEIQGADLLIIPGTKNTIGDLRWLKRSGMADAVISFAKKNNPVLGICGGYQMLGEEVSDPEGVEEGGTEEGLCLLPVKTTLLKKKTTRQAEGIVLAGRLMEENFLDPLKGYAVRGYEIHMGETLPTGGEHQQGLFMLNGHPDGEVRGEVYGTYLHGLFDEGDLAFRVTELLAGRKGIEISKEGNTEKSYREFRESQYDLLADVLRAHMDMDAVYGMLRKAPF